MIAEAELGKVGFGDIGDFEKVLEISGEGVSTPLKGG